MSSPGSHISRFFVVMTLVLLIPVSVAALEQKVGLYNNGIYTPLGTLSADHENGGIDAFLESIYPFAGTLDKTQGWDYRWLMVVFGSDQTVKDSSGAVIEYPTAYPPAGGTNLEPNDTDPFFWDTEDVWPEMHSEGELSYYGYQYQAERFEPGGDEIVEVFSVLYNPAHPKKIVLLENGSFTFGLFYSTAYNEQYGLTGSQLIPPFNAKTDLGREINTQATADYLEEALENAGFDGWTVIPTCSKCAFSLNSIK